MSFKSTNLIKYPDTSGLCHPFSGVNAALQIDNLFIISASSDSNLPDVTTFVRLTDDFVAHERVIGSSFLHESYQLI